MEYSDPKGFPVPLTNGGFDEKGVAVRDVWADSKTQLWDLTPTPQLGSYHSETAIVMMGIADTARESAEIDCDLIAKNGYTDYGGDSYLIADKNEGRVVGESAGGQKLWAAQRLIMDKVRVLYPGYIVDSPKDHVPNTTAAGDYLGSPNIVSCAIKQGRRNPSDSELFKFFKTCDLQRRYAARHGGFRYLAQAALEEATLATVLNKI
ncbi:hypothetical protein DOTSEDRAFT_26458 [Dothistroma septosporum NZE10]|uniref:Uncharacterized protein n=1 Tax=Dothistroma septosporum (strain NZE10 / CBS 128990) TaxID=675120 RepID=N1PGM6_DOTSN|nr:hypothetical protein DOTSEDRAFT_26458 [Dothistroma septosporum NZE10]